MYLPFLRGKQYELIALRELVNLPLNPNKISPIIEPVKKSFNSLTTAAIALNSIGVKCQIIINPENGDLRGKTAEILNFIVTQEKANGLDNLIPTFLIKSSNDFRSFQSFRSNVIWSGSQFSLIHLKQIPEVDQMTQYLQGSQQFANVIHVNVSPRATASLLILIYF